MIASIELRGYDTGYELLSPFRRWHGCAVHRSRCPLSSGMRSERWNAAFGMLCDPDHRAPRVQNYTRLLGTGRREGSSLLSAASVPSTLLARADDLERPRHLESNASGGAKR